MTPLHLSKVPAGCTSLSALRRRQFARIERGTVVVTTRFRPKQADALIGGSLYWIIGHRLRARQEILGFEVREEDGRTLIRLRADLQMVENWPRRAHQGWRYLAAGDAPPDLGGGEGVGALPPRLAETLTALALV